jgi:hypothetical protein
LGNETRRESNCESEERRKKNKVEGKGEMRREEK